MPRTVETIAVRMGRRDRSAHRQAPATAAPRRSPRGTPRHRRALAVCAVAAAGLAFVGVVTGLSRLVSHPPFSIPVIRSPLNVVPGLTAPARR